MRGAHPERAVEQVITSNGVIRSGERVLIACSGGPDSVALAAALHAVSKRMALHLCIGHVNHGLRASAWQDECVVLRIAATYDLPLEVITLPDGSRNEQRLREARYAALIDAALRRRCAVIATAHHAEDQSETVLLALLRGSGPSGLAGMPARRSLRAGLDLARPLLSVPSDALLEYCYANALPFAADPTNADTGLRRNAVREALEALRPLFPGLDGAVARAAELVHDERRTSDRAGLRRRVRERLASQGELRDIDFTHVEAAVRALESGRTGTFHMKPGLSLKIEQGSIAGIKRE
jgi:tRNA(Ile)-lysidine synthase